MHIPLLAEGGVVEGEVVGGAGEGEGEEVDVVRLIAAV
jgi:hypothetical protein